MKLTNKYYVDDRGNMIRYTRYITNIHEVDAIPFHSKLKIESISLLNNGLCLRLQDENGKIYTMNDAMLDKYLENNDIFLEGDWNFYKQGTSFSIGL